MQKELFMEKKTYYVTVQSGEIMDDPTAFNYDFVIEASEEEYDQLKELFEDTADAEEATYTHSFSVSLSTYYNEENTTYDNSLREIYKKLHELGTIETKRHIETMNILDTNTKT
jgi:rubrerythrin